MPIAMTGSDAPGKQIMCYPLPLFEESNQRLPLSHNKISRYFHLDDKSLHRKFSLWAFWKEIQQIHPLKTATSPGRKSAARIARIFLSSSLAPTAMWQR
ncbi:hypothetical protein GTU79_15020 [Sodalis ligni]|uniref:hypothetical protein n=1 Tax=Sodalis ligni TaxID=2697027 RepID=UPI001BDED247|nr:hypothetical protein [Sodalis ligni]QWA08866.1 hypothetical protein GTU79_15020 [Sodalis ligni]